MNRSALLLLGLFCCLGTDCEGNPPAGAMTPGTSNCAIENGPGFTIDLPCEARWDGQTEITPGLVYEKVFSDEAGTTFGLEVVSASELASGGGGGVNLGGQGSVRLDGTFRTAHGDFVILATLRLDVADVFRALTFLADGNLLRVNIISATRTRDQNLLTLGSLSLADTDGSAILTWLQDESSKLLAPFDDEFVILDDASVWSVDSSNRVHFALWNTGDVVFALPADRFFRDAFLTRIPDWISYPVTFEDVADLLEVESIASDFGCTEVDLSDGATWTACTDHSVLDGLEVGDTVAFFGASFGSAFIMDLSTGKAAFVID